MNRILRPTLSVRACRIFTIMAIALLFINFSYAQCPPKVANVETGTTINGTPTTCQADFQVLGLPTGSAWGSTGATLNSAGIPISMLEAGQTFNFGLTEVFIDTSADMTPDCFIMLVVSEVAEIPLDICDDITVDLNGECSGEFLLPAEIDIVQNACDVGFDDVFYFSTSNTTNERTLVANAHGGNPTFHSIFLRKFRDGALYREFSCMIEVTTINPTVPVLSCPSDLSVEVAPSCQYIYAYDVESASTIPCGGSIVMSQAGGGPSGTPLGAGTYTYAYELYDESGATVTGVVGAEPCSWTVTVTQSATAGAQLNCIGHLNVSIDQNCMATIDPTTILSGSLCTDPTLLMVSADLPVGDDLGPAPSITFDESHVGMDISVSVSDPNDVNSCWGVVTIEDKLAPVLICPADMTVTCTMPTDTSVMGVPTLASGLTFSNETLAAATISNGFCEAELFYRDAVQNNLCGGLYQSIITRTFYAVDNAGNMSAPCIQTIYVERELLSSATYPPHWDGLATHFGISDNGVSSNPPLACDGAGTEWAADTLEDGRVIPSPFDSGLIPGTGAPGDVGTCGTIFAFYEDIYLDICNDNCESNHPSFKVLRTWDVFDWCTGEFALHEQIIKVLDTVAPVFTTAVPDLTVSTDLWGCGATIYLPTVSAVDQCSKDIKYTWSVSGGTYDPVAGTVHVPSVALTTPGNEVLLIAAAEDCCGNIAVDTGLVTIVDNLEPIVVAEEHTVVTLNNQSDDGATKVHADSFDDGSFDGCGPIDFWVRRMDTACKDYDGLDEEGKEDPTEIDEINDFHKYVHFCCEDTEEDQMIVFMVCDDADRDGTPEMNGDDNCNTAMILVDVQDKLAPTIVCPLDRTINCIDFVVFEDLLGETLDDDQMEFLNAQFGEAYSNSTCGELGVQIFDGDDFCGEGTAKRTFTVTSSTGTASCSQDIKIVADKENVLTCDRISFPTLSLAPYNYNWCDPSDNVEPFVTPVQVKECGAVNIERPVVNIDNLCTEVGINLTLDTFNFAGGACMKILAHWEVIDQCLFVENFLDNKGDEDEIDPFVNENGYYEIYVEYDIFDTEGPDMSCDDVEVATTDCVKNYDSFSVSATDDCTAPEIISYTFKVDIGNDGVFDYPVGGGYAEGNTFNAESVGGLAIGTHAIKWLAYDGCGNYTSCHQEINVGKQIKAPTPYCHLGVSSAVMDSIYGCSVEVWATDFVAGGSDDCDANLTYLMIPYQDIYGDPADETDDLDFDEAKDMAMANWTFDCKYIENGEQHVVEIRVYAIDEDGKYDFCDASLTLNDNFDCCEDLFGISSSIAGNVATEEGMLVEDVEINIMSDNPEFPRIQNTSKEGNYMFTGLPYNDNYDITAYNNEDTKKGVSTLDLVLIQRHILGITTLDSPFKLIAADINNNEVISAADLLQLRKLILGIYPGDKLPNNNSWRFVDNSSGFVDATNPFPFDEMVKVNQLSHSMYNQNFVGVKVGDVNGSVAASLSGNAQVRSKKNFEMIANDASYKAGEIVAVDFTSKDIAALYGLQFTYEFNTSLIVNSIISGVLSINESNYTLSDNSLALSWNEAELVSIDKDEALFTIEFTALKDGQLSESAEISNKTLMAESYSADFNTNGVVVDYRTVEDESFSLLQNEPNPFGGNTRISFILPDAGNATLKIYDVTGKTILSKNESFAKGMNTVIVNSKELCASGVLYYQLTYGSNSATRKMILLD